MKAAHPPFLSWVRQTLISIGKVDYDKSVDLRPHVCAFPWPSLFLYVLLFFNLLDGPSCHMDTTFDHVTDHVTVPEKWQVASHKMSADASFFWASICGCDVTLQCQKQPDTVNRA